MATIDVLAFEIAKLELKPDDVLVVRYQEHSQSLEQRRAFIEEMTDTMNAVMPEGVNYIICTNDVEFSVVKKVKRNEIHLDK